MTYPSRDPWLDRPAFSEEGMRVVRVTPTAVSVVLWTQDMPGYTVTNADTIAFDLDAGAFQRHNGVLYAHGMLLDPTDGQIAEAA